VLPAKMAFQLTAEWASSTMTLPVFAIMAPSLLLGGKNFHPLRLPNTGPGNLVPNFRSSREVEQNVQPPNYTSTTKEAVMGFGRGMLLWLIGIPLPIILLLALFMHR
jgi:hypothetical protein